MLATHDWLVQEFVELVRQERMLDAIAYSRKHLAPWAGQYQAELQRALTALAFKAGTQCAPYAALFSEAAWLACADLFRKDLYRLHSMPPESQLKVHLQVFCTAPAFSLLTVSLSFASIV